MKVLSRFRGKCCIIAKDMGISSELWTSLRPQLICTPPTLEITLVAYIELIVWA